LAGALPAVRKFNNTSRDFRNRRRGAKKGEIGRKAEKRKGKVYRKGQRKMRDKRCSKEGQRRKRGEKRREGMRRKEKIIHSAMPESWQPRCHNV